MSSQNYQQKKAFFDRLLTIYGRKPVLEALQNPAINFHKLHLAESNRSGGIVAEMLQLAEKRGIEVEHHSRQELSRISKNGKQDQGVAADLELDNYRSLEDFLNHPPRRDYRLLALDRVTNPQNLGMIIRSACAGDIDGLLIPSKGCAALNPLVIKASTGTLFKAPIVRCESLSQALKALQQQGSEIVTLSSHAKQSLFEFQPTGAHTFILGNESDGVSREVMNLSNQSVAIPMNNGVESLNVAVTAALIAFQPRG